MKTFNKINVGNNDVYCESNINHDTFLLLGDSYGTGTNAVEKTNGWGDRIKGYFKRAGYQCVTHCVNGMSFGGELKASDELTKAINSVENINDITDIAIVLGYNDMYSDIANIKADIDKCGEIINSIGHHVNKYIGFVGNSPYADNTSAIIKGIKAYKDYGIYAGFRYMDGVELVMHDYTYFIDGIHPTNTGQAWVTRAIFDSIVSGSFSPTYLMSYNDLTNLNQITQKPSGHILQVLTGNTVSLNVNLGRVKWNDSVVVGTQSYLIGYFDKKYVKGFNNLNGRITGTAQVETDIGTLYYPCTCAFVNRDATTVSMIVNILVPSEQKPEAHYITFDLNTLTMPTLLA